LCARYFNNGQINLLFVPVTDVTGNGLASTLLTSLDLIGIDYNYTIGQGCCRNEWRISWCSRLYPRKMFPSNTNMNDYPNIYKLLKVVATLPITTATAEKSFSTMQRLKIYQKYHGRESFK